MLNLHYSGKKVPSVGQKFNSYMISAQVAPVPVAWIGVWGWAAQNGHQHQRSMKRRTNTSRIDWARRVAFAPLIPWGTVGNSPTHPRRPKTAPANRVENNGIHCNRWHKEANIRSRRPCVAKNTRQGDIGAFWDSIALGKDTTVYYYCKEKKIKNK